MSDERHDASSHVDHATIDVSQAEIIQSPRSKQQARYLAYATAVLFLFTIGIGLANLLYTSSNVRQVRANSAAIQKQVLVNQRIIARQQMIITALEKQIIASCNFYADLASLPVANFQTGKPSELAVKIVSDSRGTWHGLDCPGTLPPPDPTFIAGAKLYHLPVN